MKKQMIKQAARLLAACLTVCLAAGCGKSTEEQPPEAVSSAESEATPEAVSSAESEAAPEAVSSAESEAASEKDPAGEPVEIQVFIAASLNTVMTEIAETYQKDHPEIRIVFNADSSGKLLTQIEEGYTCDVFFSAAQKQMNALEEDGLVVEGSRANVVNNQVVVITRKDSGTAVTGLEDIGKAESIALADGSVPVGRYTRTALMNLGILPETEDPAVYTTAEVSEALGGVEISEQGNVSQVLQAVAEASCEVGTTYYSDTYGHEDDLEILQTVSYDLTGDVIYPIAQVVNEEADEKELQAAADFIGYILSDECKTVFDAYYFDTDVER